MTPKLLGGVERGPFVGNFLEDDGPWPRGLPAKIGNLHDSMMQGTTATYTVFATNDPIIQAVSIYPIFIYTPGIHPDDIIQWFVGSLVS